MTADYPSQARTMDDHVTRFMDVNIWGIYSLQVCRSRGSPGSSAGKLPCNASPPNLNKKYPPPQYQTFPLTYRRPLHIGVAGMILREIRRCSAAETSSLYILDGSFRKYGRGPQYRPQKTIVLTPIYPSKRRDALPQRRRHECGSHGEVHIVPGMLRG